METRIGISGWRYEPWRNVFYPDKLPQAKELYYASRQMTSIEINGSFYSLQKPSSYQKWFADTPDDFMFSIKGPQYITHVRRLKDVEKPLANFFGSGVLHLKHKMGPILWQFPPSFRYDEERLENFFKLLPRTIQDAAKLSKKADRVDPDYPEEAKKSPAPLRHAIEVRHPSFENPDFVELVRKYNVAIVFADTAGRWPYIEDVTSDFVYLRLHGDEELYASGYGDETLKWWAKRIRTWQKGNMPKPDYAVTDTKPPQRSRDAFIYFDNDVKVHAPYDAQTLMRYLKV
ncbi:hypothetical protein AZI86_13860 [Bdellovibrio bacteriovorus]|uniref:DUF72 domain-containing protein n=1 Tax=Bdellovibrio bacteriovorus TaxID=959 RepID=A0A150WJF5_BDEBC|nr:DUF72 domain-containing protein [Bdellovibrio bacteriovorus]KYG63898.1 hypothetical protein AZI86_13860 [Bdellovibrio bacteriovorus]